jgi:hypothetical protein
MDAAGLIRCALSHHGFDARIAGRAIAFSSVFEFGRLLPPASASNCFTQYNELESSTNGLIDLMTSFI